LWRQPLVCGLLSWSLEFGDFSVSPPKSITCFMVYLTLNRTIIYSLFIEEDLKQAIESKTHVYNVYWGKNQERSRLIFSDFHTIWLYFSNRIWPVERMHVLRRFTLSLHLTAPSSEVAAWSKLSSELAPAFWTAKATIVWFILSKQIKKAERERVVWTF